MWYIRILEKSQVTMNFRKITHISPTLTYTYTHTSFPSPIYAKPMEKDLWEVKPEHVLF